MRPAIGVVVKREHEGVELKDEVYLGTYYKVDLDSIQHGVWKNVYTGKETPGANIMAKHNEVGTWGAIPLDMLTLIVPEEGK